MSLADRFRRIARFETSLALACALIPAVLIAFDGWPPRASISDYWNMGSDQVYVFTLTVAAMLFMVRGARRENHWHNFVLGIALALLTLFDHTNWQPWHGIFTVTFFVGGVLAIAFISEGDWARRVRWWLVGLTAVVMLLWKPFGVISLLVAEWIALAAFAAHFIAHAYEQDPTTGQHRYKAP